MILGVSSCTEILQLFGALARDNNKSYYGVPTIEEFEDFKTNENIELIIFYSHLSSNNRLPGIILAENAHQYIQQYFNKPVIILTTNENKNFVHDDLKVYRAPVDIETLRKIFSSST